MSTLPVTPWLGTESQIEWAEKIKPLVSAEFDRVAETLEAVARRQSVTDRLETRAMIAIVEEKRVEVLGRTEAGYFIKNWQELTDQVQRLIRDDSRFAAVRLAKAARSGDTVIQAEALTESSAQKAKRRFTHERQTTIRPHHCEKKRGKGKHAATAFSFQTRRRRSRTRAK